MIRFILARLVQVVAIAVVMSFIIYALIGLMPGDPIDLMLSSDPHLTAADVARLKQLRGLDQPLGKRYLAWAKATLSGDLGYSRLYRAPTSAVILPRLANTGVLMGTSFVLALAIALPLGALAARRPGALLDTIANLLAFAGISIPPFWLALVLIIVFAVSLGWLPAGGVATVGDGGLADRLSHLVLPVTTLTLASVGGYLRFMRSSMIEALRQDYVRTARAKGASASRVLWAHALRNGIIPVITIVALSFGSLFSGALITEKMFGYPGMGSLIYDAILGNDFNVALAALLFATVLVMVSNLVADIAYAAADPRITYR
jgi:peptide/nickel transport system permease protein